MMPRGATLFYVALGAALAIGSYLAIRPVPQWATLDSLRAPVIVSFSASR